MEKRCPIVDGGRIDALIVDKGGNSMSRSRKDHHFICEVTDNINDNRLVISEYHDTSTIIKAVKYFRTSEKIKKYLLSNRYNVIMRANSVDLNYNKYSGYREIK